MLEKKRRYEDGCAFAQALDLVGERWAFLVIRELVFGPKRFSDLRASLPGIATNVLSQRLEDLEKGSVILRRELPPPARVQVYDLTDWGREIAPVFSTLGRWAARSPHLVRGRWPMSVNSTLLSLVTMFRGDLAGDFSARMEFRFGGQPFAVTVGEGRLAVEPGPQESPEVVVEGEQNALLGVVYAGRPLEAAEAEGALRVEGGREKLLAFARFFPLPEPAPA